MEDKKYLFGLGAYRLLLACMFLLLNYNQLGLVNIGTGSDITISELALIIKEIVEYEDELVFDHSKPDGTSRKLLDVQKINKLEWKHKIELRKGLELIKIELKTSKQF